VQLFGAKKLEPRKTHFAEKQIMLPK